MSSANALVIGSATNLPASHFLPFFESLRATGFAGHTCVFVANMKDAQRVRLAHAVDEVVLLDDRHAAAAPDAVVRALKWSKSTKGMRKHFPGLVRSYCRVARVRPGSPVAD